jgi:hypothetical protein
VSSGFEEPPALAQEAPDARQGGTGDLVAVEFQNVDHSTLSRKNERV